MPTARDPELLTLGREMLRETAAAIDTAIRENGWQPKYSSFPRMAGSFRSGFPHISLDISSSVVHYTDVVRAGHGPFKSVWYDDLASFRRLFEYVDAHPRLADYLNLKTGRDQDVGENFARISVALPFLSLLERILHLHGFDFTDEDFEESYLELEAGLLGDDLPVEIVVPIPLVAFETDGRIELGDDLSLERMNDAWQLARMPSSMVGMSEAVSGPVLSAATHAFVFARWTVSNPHYFASGLGRRDAYPVERINRAMIALRLVTGSRAGYAQLALRPIGWSRGWKAHLPPIAGNAIVRRYPPKFDDWGWLADPAAPIGITALRDVGELDSLLATAPSQLQLAARRYLGAGLREVEEDEMLDLCIGLEAALGDRSPNEVTHKLALRAATVLAGPRLNAAVIFDDIRAIYRYRSAIVHGTSPEKKRLIRRSEDVAIPAVDQASDYLRRVVRALLRQPRWQDPKVIDRDLVLGRAGLDDQS